MRSAAAVVWAILVMTAPGAARANDDVERGRARAAEADFDAALADFARAEQTTLDFAAYVRLVEGRALVHLGVGDREALERDLVQLASFDPEHAFAPDLPPELTQELARVRRTVTRRLSVEPLVTPVPGGVSIAGRVRDDPGSVARHVRVRVRVASGEWSEALDRAVSVPAAPNAVVEHWIVVEGPGGAPLASAGSEAAPLRWGGAPRTGPGRGAGGPQLDEGGISPWVFVGIGAAVVAVVATIIVIAVVSSESAGSRPRPVVIGF